MYKYVVLRDCLLLTFRFPMVSLIPPSGLQGWPTLCCWLSVFPGVPGSSSRLPKGDRLFVVDFLFLDHGLPASCAGVHWWLTLACGVLESTFGLTDSGPFLMVTRLELASSTFHHSVQGCIQQVPNFPSFLASASSLSKVPGFQHSRLSPCRVPDLQPLPTCRVTGCLPSKIPRPPGFECKGSCKVDSSSRWNPCYPRSYLELSFKCVMSWSRESSSLNQIMDPAMRADSHNREGFCDAWRDCSRNVQKQPITWQRKLFSFNSLPLGDALTAELTSDCTSDPRSLKRLYKILFIKNINDEQKMSKDVWSACRTTLFSPLGLVANGQVFKCRSFETCPGGPPGTRGGGLVGTPCAECPAGPVTPAMSSGLGDAID